MNGSSGALFRFSRNLPATVGAVVLAVIALIAVFAPAIYGTGPWDIVSRPFYWPFEKAGLPLGTDMLGRDILAGMFDGARASLLIGSLATAMAVLLGLVVGLLAGFYGRRVDNVLMRVTEIFQTIPSFVLVVILVAMLKPSVGTVIIALGAVTWPTIARIVRAETLSLREREFVQAGIAIGMSDTRLLFVHILPNALPPVIIAASLLMAQAILLEAGLSFLGLGDPNVMSWGTIMGNGREVLRQYWYISAMPGVAILVTVLALNLVGEGINDALNPKLRQL
ncbi:MAG: ABC transporter permease [Rhizobiales bacterium]|nr:ABC transporter permease [Hyphomicrobiales bacterium]OJU30083.1 MAG: ABC transporter permease [Rhizobiales bacterium 68-8]